MRTNAIVLIALILSLELSVQVPQVMDGKYIWDAKEFSKEIALFHSKQFLFTNVLGVSTDIVQFEVTPLAAASSGELRNT